MACADEKASASFVAEQLCNLLDNRRDLLPYYLSNNAVLKWFGRTISGKKNVCEFVASEMAQTIHMLTSVEPGSIQLHNSEESCNSAATPSKGLSPDVGYSERDYHLTQERNIAQMKNLAFSEESKNGNCLHTEEKPPKDVMMMGDSALNTCCMPVSTKVEEGQGDCMPHIFKRNCKVFQALGSLQFSRTKQSPTSSRNLKLLTDTMKWERMCKVYVEYNVPSGPNSNEFEINLLVYEDTIKCRRNLALEFDKVADESF